MKALSFDEASKKFKIFNFTNENFENIFSSKFGIVFTKVYDLIANFVGLLSGKHHNFIGIIAKDVYYNGCIYLIVMDIYLQVQRIEKWVTI